MRLLATLVLVPFLFGAAQAAELPASVRSALQHAHIPLSAVGLEVREAGSRKPLLSVNADRPMNPASTMKLLTTFAGLDLLGPAYTWKTEAWVDGKLDKGVLQGNLVLKGYGDPGLTIEQFWLWLRDLRSRGLQEIRGDLVLDHSAFLLTPEDPAEFDEDPLRAYNVGPDALLVNFNALRLRYIPDGDKVTVVTEPELAGTPLVNQVIAAGRGDCGSWSENILAQVSGSALTLQGSFPAKCGEREQYLSLLPHSTYLFGVFRALWQELGGKLAGGVRDGNVPANALLFSTHVSPSLSEQIRAMNKFSNNVMARQLFLTLSLGEQAPASVARSEQIVRDWLERKGLRFSELVLENGAGLSRRERISARSMAALLQTAQHSLYQAELEASLPILGMDGTLRKRLLNDPATGHAHLKTGTLAGVKSIAGYVQGRNNKQWVVTFFINHPHAAAGQAAQDALVEWLERR